MIQNNLVTKTEDFIKEWNQTFPFDKWYRDRYKIGLFSKAHLELCQIDIYMEWKEHQVFEGYIKLIQENEERLKDFKKGNILKSQDSGEVVDDLWDKMNMNQFKGK